jgi:hypothetical protein
VRNIKYFININIIIIIIISAASDTVDRRMLLMRMQTSLGVSGPVLVWFMSCYLNTRQGERRLPMRTYCVVCLSVCQVRCASGIRPILFLLHTVDLPNIIEAHGLQPHIYADDTQIYGDSSPSTAQQLQQPLSVSMDDVAKWMRSNGLQLNESKTEILW